MFLKKRRRKIVRNGRTFWWCVKPNDSTYQGLLFSIDEGLYTDDENTFLSIISDDKKFIVSYHLNQRNENSKIKSPYIITEGKEFKGLDNLGHGWKKFVVPEWDFEIVTPSVVAEIIDWCFIVENVTAVDWLGNILDKPYN